MSVRCVISFEVGRSSPTLLPRARARRLIRKAVRTTLAYEGVEAAHVEVTLLDDEDMSELNRTYLGQNGTTDVISFALYQEGEEPVGDIYIGWDQALRQAAALGDAPEGDLVRLAVHGAMHLLGCDNQRGGAEALGAVG